MKYWVWAGAALLGLLGLTLVAYLAQASLDAAELPWVQQAIRWRNPPTTVLIQLLTFIASAAFCAVLMALLSLYQLIRRSGTLNPLGWLRYWPLAWPAFAFAGSIGSNILLRIGVGRLPPEVEYVSTLLPELYAGFHRFSFPSGHAGTAMVTYLSLLSFARTNNLRLLTLMRASAAFVILSTGLGRVYLGVHWPSDVLAGFLLGFVWWALGLALRDRLCKTR